MIPLHLKLSGFLSYHETVEVDFSGFDLACISGSNGAGKSSLLDAITWALFGQARKRDEALINLQSKLAEVAFTFAYENSIYRALNRLPDVGLLTEARRTTQMGWTRLSWVANPTPETDRPHGYGPTVAIGHTTRPGCSGKRRTLARKA